jgi:hypothetical protein
VPWCATQAERFVINVSEHEQQEEVVWTSIQQEQCRTNKKEE